MNLDFKIFSDRNFNKVISIVLIFALFNLIVGCTYYEVNTVKLPSTETGSFVNQMQKRNKYFILHEGKKAMHLFNISVNEETKVLTGELEELSLKHQYYLTTDSLHTNRYSARYSAGDPTIEVHIYISGQTLKEGVNIIIPVTSINKIEVYDLAIGTTIASYVFSTLSVLVVIIIIILSTKSSCPFVYTYSENSIRFNGEMYGGAIYPSLERNDYMPLPDFNPVNEFYKLKISNELLERQYTNLAELIVVQHQANSKVLLDKNGNVQTISNPVSPEKALSKNNINYAKILSKTDSSCFLFDDDMDSENKLESLNLTFPKAEKAKTAKLILNAKSSLWLDYMYGKFNEQFGTYYNTFAEKQKSVSAEKNKQWALDQGIPLSVYIETKTGWKLADYFNVIGPLASRDVVMPIDISDVEGNEINIKLECGGMFWEIDYAAVDFSENSPIEIKHISPASAIDEKGIDVSNELVSVDDKYLVQPEIGNEAIIKYKAPDFNKGLSQSVFLNTRGYYEYIRNYTNSPNLIRLYSFEKKGSFNSFSKELYQDFVQNENLLVNAMKENYGN